MTPQIFSNTNITLHSPDFDFSPVTTAYGVIHTDSCPCLAPSTFTDITSCIYDLLACTYSNCVVHYETDIEIFIIAGSMSSGLYYSLCNTSLSIFRSERAAYSYSLSISNFQLNTTELVSSLLSHQLCSSAPFTSLDKHTSYLPPATILSINKNNYETSLIPIVLFLSNSCSSKVSSFDFDRCLNFSISSILYHYRWVKLLFSGGLDSSLLYTHLVNLRWSGQSLYKDYNALTSYNQISSRKSQSYYTSNVASFLSVDLTIEQASYDKVNVKYLINKAVNTSKAFISTRYIAFQSIISQNTTHSPINYLTGQNADTLFQFDTYAPSTEATFVKRIILNISAVNERFSFFCKVLLGRILHFFLPGSNYLKFYQESISNLSSLSEHIQSKPTRILREYFPDISEYHKIRTHVFSIANFLSPQILTSFHDLDFDVQLKLIRHYRTIQNSARNIYEQFVFNGSDFRIMPFMHGPLYLNLFFRKFQLVDIFFPKSSLYKSFFSRNGYTFRSIFDLSDFFEELILLFRRVLSRSRLTENTYDNDKKIVLIKNLYLAAFEKYNPDIYLPLLNYLSNGDDTSEFHCCIFREHLYSIHNSLLSHDECNLNLIVASLGERYVIRLLNLYIFLNGLYFASKI